MRWSALAAVPLSAAAVVLLSCEDPFQPRSPVSRAPTGAALVGAAASGSWSTPFSWPLIAAHLGVLPDGRLISWVSGYVAGDVEVHHVYLWNPTTGSFTEMTDGTENIFCSGNAFLPDGRLLIPGGHISESHGLKDTYLFDGGSNTWEDAPLMRAGRWYPTTTVLANGYASVVGGTEEDGSANRYPEIWDGTGWRPLRGALLDMLYFYPRMHPAPDGRVFNSGPDFVSRYLNPSGAGEWTDGPPSNGGLREYGGSIMYAPGKILIAGGGDPPTSTAETIDLNTGGAWQATGSMQYPRRQMNSTVLPDGKVLVIGGSKGPGFSNESQPVLAPELWNPNTGTWTTLASMQVPRLYHSTAVLLPDARVLAAGGGRCTTCTDHYDAELFSPPYLFAADGSLASRPTITLAPTSVSYGQAFTVETAEPSTIGRVTWVRLPATTHAFDQNQWINELAFTATSGGLSVTAPANAYLAPPGHYMLFILNSSGVPSVARIVQLQGSAPLPPAPARPSAPTKLVATSINAQQIRLNWTDNSTSETDFLIEQCLGQACTNFAEIARVDPQVKVYQVGSLLTGTAYRFRVRARNDAGYSGYSNSATGATTTGETVTVRTILSGLASKCVEVEGGGQLNGTRIFITPCAGAPNRQWTVPPAGHPGEIQMFGTMCLDAYGAQGNVGDRIELWECAGGANQRWTLTTAGELKGISGLCITLNGGATADSTGMAIQPCTGAPAQKWSYGSADGNQSPQANFTSSCSGLTCSFTDGSTDPDGSVTAWSWTFGDGSSSTARNPTRPYASGGTYTVTLTVTDDDGATNQRSMPVTVSALPAATIRLSDSFNRVVATGAGTADGGSDANKTWEMWEGAGSDVNVDGSALVLTNNIGAWRGLVGTESAANVDGSVEVSAVNSDAALLGLYLRVSGGPADNYQFQWTGGALTIWRSTRAGGDVVLATVAQARNAAFKLRAQVETAGASVVLRLKYWTGGTEPAAWTLTATDTSPNRIMSGGYGLRVLNGGTSDMRIDNFVVKSN